MKSCGYMSRIQPWAERSMPIEERHPSTDLREERGQERMGFDGGPFGNRRFSVEDFFAKEEAEVSGGAWVGWGGGLQGR
ncbi:hypothetical protein DVH24_013805 [Malus domestica]|uniref:Uncharacterized protein n=1 Tax=Malus domestica TaxID=3750 RepID=A0A498JBQ2_MALDO|nr:hypothetical protein DVH24_013805 [Malus domestica]